MCTKIQTHPYLKHRYLDVRATNVALTIFWSQYYGQKQVTQAGMLQKNLKLLHKLNELIFLTSV